MNVRAPGNIASPRSYRPGPACPAPGRCPGLGRHRPVADGGGPPAGPVAFEPALLARPVPRGGPGRVGRSGAARPTAEAGRGRPGLLADIWAESPVDCGRPRRPAGAARQGGQRGHRQPDAARDGLPLPPAPPRPHPPLGRRDRRARPAGERIVPVEDFLQGPDDARRTENSLGPGVLIVSIRIPTQRDGLNLKQPQTAGRH